MAAGRQDDAESRGESGNGQLSGGASQNTAQEGGQSGEHRGDGTGEGSGTAVSGSADGESNGPASGSNSSAGAADSRADTDISTAGRGADSGRTADADSSGDNGSSTQQGSGTGLNDATETININGSLQVIDDNDQEHLRPNQITVHLYAQVGEGEKTEVAQQGIIVRPDAPPEPGPAHIAIAVDEYSFTFFNMPRYQQGQEIQYSVATDPIEKYTVTVDGYNITATHWPPPHYSAHRSDEDTGNGGSKRRSRGRGTAGTYGTRTDAAYTASADTADTVSSSDATRHVNRADSAPETDDPALSILPEAAAASAAVVVMLLCRRRRSAR
ncbi:MAG: Cna B-type domain-containing protein [Anaerovoracaceae bacterium]